MFKRGDGLKLASLAAYSASAALASVGVSFWLNGGPWLMALLLADMTCIISVLFATLGQKRGYTSFGMLMFVFSLIATVACIGASIGFNFFTL